MAGTAAKTPASPERIRRELERERHAHRQLDEERAGVDPQDELRIKDARETDRSARLRR